MSTFLFNFKKQFAPLVERGEKLQTIRQRRKDGRQPHSGDVVKLYTGLRTRQARLLLEGPVVDCFPIYLQYDRHSGGRIVSNGVLLHPGEANAFAKLDGFTSDVEMLNWFRETYPLREDFEGFCVRWSTRPVLAQETAR